LYFLDVYFQIDDIVMPPYQLQKYLNQYAIEFTTAVPSILLSLASGSHPLQNKICASAYQRALFMRGVFEGIFSSKVVIGHTLLPWSKLENERRLKTVSIFL